MFRILIRPNLPVGNSPIDFHLVINTEAHVFNNISCDTLQSIIISIVETPHVLGEEHVVNG